MYCLLMQAAWISILYRGLACTVNTARPVCLAVFVSDIIKYVEGK